MRLCRTARGLHTRQAARGDEPALCGCLSVSNNDGERADSYCAYVPIGLSSSRRWSRTVSQLVPCSEGAAEVVEVLIQCMDWNIASCQSRIPESELPDLHQKVVELLDLLQKNLPDKTGEKAKW